MKVFAGSLISIAGGFLILIFYKEWDYFRAMAYPMILLGWIMLLAGPTTYLTNKQLHRHIRDQHTPGDWK